MFYSYINVALIYLVSSRNPLTKNTLSVQKSIQQRISLPRQKKKLIVLSKAGIFKFTKDGKYFLWQQGENSEILEFSFLL